MSVLKKEEFFSKLHERLGSDTSEEGLTFLEDIMDTYNDLENRANSNNTVDWEKKYHELDESWRNRYRHRFFTGGGGTIPDVKNGDNSDENSYDPESVKLSDLFTNTQTN